MHVEAIDKEFSISEHCSLANVYIYSNDYARNSGANWPCIFQLVIPAVYAWPHGVVEPRWKNDIILAHWNFWST